MPCTKCKKKHKKCGGPECHKKHKKKHKKCGCGNPKGGSLETDGKESTGETIEKYVRMTPWGAAIGAVTDLIPQNRAPELYRPDPDTWRAQQFKKQHYRLTPDQVTWQLAHKDDSVYYQMALVQHGHPSDY